MIGIVWFPKGVGSILWARHFQTPYPLVSFLFYRYYPLEVCPGVISTGIYHKLGIITKLTWYYLKDTVMIVPPSMNINTKSAVRPLNEPSSNIRQ